MVRWPIGAPGRRQMLTAGQGMSSMNRSGRSVVVLRDAGPADVVLLAELWVDSLRRRDAEGRAEDVHRVLDRAARVEGERVLIAELGGQPAGAVLIRLTTLTPINLEPVVQALAPAVLPGMQRRGVGAALMDGAVTFAEQHGAGHVSTAARSGSREANRFMARLGFTAHATYRISPTVRLRALVSTHYRDHPETGGRPIGRVLALRRSMGRAGESPGSTVLRGTALDEGAGDP